jgi:hypothetical protein
MRREQTFPPSPWNGKVAKRIVNQLVGDDAGVVPAVSDAAERRFAERQRVADAGELIDRIAASGPVRKLLVVEALGHTRVPFAGYRPDHRGGVKLGHNRRAAEAAADLEAWLANPSSPNGAG